MYADMYVDSFNRLGWCTLRQSCAYELPKPMIVGGTDAKENELPWQVSLQDSTGYHYCGAAILSTYFIITAAHCAQYEVDFYRVHAGSIDIRTPLSTHQVIKKYIHAGYGTTDFGASVYDIAIMSINPPFEFSPSIAPVQLPEQCMPTPVGTFLTVSGWGSTKTLGANAKILQKVQVPIVSTVNCNESYSDYGGISEGTICAGYEEGGKDSCQGDSGGPLVLGNELRGIVSWGSFLCAQPGVPGVYTEVSYFRYWIRKITGL